MPKDSLQILAAGELYSRKWVLNPENYIWFIRLDEYNLSTSPNFEVTNSSKEEYNFFNPNEWKIQRYVYSSLNQSSFVPLSQIKKYLDMLQLGVSK